MELECPVCHTSNPPGSLACANCSNPIDATGIFDDSATRPDVVIEADHVSGAPLISGSLLANRYEILKMLGEGGMGAVYKALDRELDKFVALKVIRGDLADNPDILQRFKQELILSRLVTHRNVIRIYDLGVAGNVKFITMDFVEGRDLKSVLTERHKLPAGEACDIIRQICLGLEAAHHEGVVHRDLKPQNVMVDAQRRVYLMDFGLARSMELVGMTRTGALLGTPAYMSPEQAKGEKVDARTDLFSLGVIFYELLTGTTPYKAESVMATLVKRSKEPPVPPNQVEPSIPQAVNDIIMKCLQIKLERRYQSAAEVLSDLGFPSMQSQTAQSSAIASPSVFEVASRLAPGSAFGPRYRIEGLLGEGGMGKVYKAYDSELDRTVALKLVRPELASSRASMDRLKQELLLASRVSHKNILRIHDLGDVAGLKFISMAFVDGKDLHHLIATEGRLPVDRAVRIARQLCLALDAAHSEGVVHRDLKPQNVLMDSHDQVFVSDFGLAKSLEGPSSVMTIAGEILGTPRYMSPEQAESKPADHRSDLYSLGLILYEMVTGDFPFGSDSVMQTMYQRVTQDPKDPRLLNPELPEYLSSVILRCLHRDPEQRYQQARDILKALDIGGGVPSERGPAIAPKTAPPSRLKRIAIWSAAGIVIVLAVLVVTVPAVRQAALSRAPGAARIVSGPGRNTKFVAILPFRTIGSDASLEDAANGVVEALSAKLFQVRNVHLASPSAAEKIKPSDPVAKIARQLGSKLIIQGTLQGAGDRLDVVLRLSDAQGKQLWTKDFSGVREDLLRIEDQIYNDVVTALDVKQTDQELARSALRPTDNAGAYELYLKGRNILRGKRDVERVKSAAGLFEQATRKDPSFALAYSGLADASIIIYNLGHEESWSQKALSAGQQAQSLNDELPEVHLALGNVYRATGKTAQAIVELKRALELAPNSDEAYRRLANAYMVANQKDQALAAYQKAIEVNPYYSLNYTRLGIAYNSLGDNQKALAALNYAAELSPDSSAAYQNIGVIYFQLGKWNEAIAAYSKALKIEPSEDLYSNLGTAYFYLGHRTDAVAMFQKAVALNSNSHVDMGNLADGYRWSGDPQKAKDAYQKAIQLALRSLKVNPVDADTLGYLALYYAKNGDPKLGLEFIRRARAIDQNGSELPYRQAVVDIIAGKPDGTLASLKEAFQKGYAVVLVKNDPEFKPLEANPEFAKLLAQYAPK